MTFDFQKLMQQATRLTQSGDLQAAAAEIQAALAGAPSTGAASCANDARMAGDAIDVESRELPDRGSAPGPQAQFIAGSFSMPGGKRDYMLYIPAGAGAADKPLPLVVMLHGCTQTPDDFAAGTAMNDAAQAQGCYVLYPAQSQQANPQRCWNWFKHNHQQRGSGEPALLASMTQTVMKQHGVDPQRVFIAGLSAGGAMAAIVAAAYPEIFAAVGVHSGLPSGAARSVAEALAVMKNGVAGPPMPARAGRFGAASTAPPQPQKPVPTIVFHGDQDQTVHPRNGEQVIAAALGKAVGAEKAHTMAAAGAQVEQGVSAQGRRYTRSTQHCAKGEVLTEHWLVHGAGHAWSGGLAAGSYTDAEGPDATVEMLRFFFGHPGASLAN